MNKRLYRTTRLLLLATLLIVGACWIYADQILDAYVRPNIERFATHYLGAEVGVGQLNWTGSGLEIRDLRVSSPRRLMVTVPRVQLYFSLATLWQRQIKGLHVTSPEIEISLQKSPQSEELPTGAPQSAALSLPEKLPLTIDSLTVSDGQLRLNTAAQQFEFRELNVSVALQQRIDFKLSAIFGQAEKHPVAISGSVDLRKDQILTLESLSWQDQQLLSAPQSIALAGAAMDLGQTKFQLAHFDQRKLQEIFVALGQLSPLPADMQFSLSGIALSLALVNQRLELNLQVTDGSIDWNALHTRFSQLRIGFNQGQDGWRIAGRLNGPARSTLDFTALITDKFELTGQARAAIPDPGHLKAELLGGSALKFAGSLQLRSDFSLENENLHATVDLQGNATERSGSDYLLNISRLSGQVKLLQSGASEKLSIQLQLAERPLLSANGNFQQLTFTLAPSTLNDLKLLLAPGRIPEPLHALNGLKGKGQVSRRTDYWTGNMQLACAAISLSEVALNELIGRTKLLIAAGRIKFEDSSVAFGMTRGDEVSAQMKITASGEVSPQSLALELQQLSLTHLNYMSRDGKKGVGEGALSLQGKVSGPWPAGPITLDLNGQLSVQELLAGAFYADLSGYSGEYSLSGKLAANNKQLMIDALTIEVPQIGNISSAGLLSPDLVRLQSQLQLVDLTESYGEHIGPLLSDFRPEISDLVLEGAMAFGTDLIWHPGGWQTNGTLQVGGLNAAWERYKLEMLDGTGTIPFAASFGTAPAKERPAMTGDRGEISFGALSIGLASLEKGRLQLAAATNRLSFRTPLLLQLAGGRVVIENLELGWPAGQPQGSVKINIAGVDLETLTEELGLPIMQGRLTANLGIIRYANRQLSTDGLANIEVFGGRFDLRNMRYSEPFSSYPTFYSDIDFSGLDLLQATRTFDFGEINGLLDGHIHGLKLFGKTPAAFQAAVTTRSKGKRNISVKALNNLSIISQGGISAALSRGIYQFINFYRYRKIGFKCSLENDTFTLVGTALSGSNRYLVHGGLFPPRIDITTTTPTISFKEMVKRIGRIERAGN